MLLAQLAQRIRQYAFADSIVPRGFEPSESLPPGHIAFP